MLIRLFTLALVIWATQSTASNYESSKLSFPLSQVDLGEEFLYDNPLLVFRSKDSSLWVIFEHIILRKRGNQVTRYQLPGDSWSYTTKEYSSLVRFAESEEWLYLSFNRQLLIFSKLKESWDLWDSLPTDNEIITGLGVDSRGMVWISTIKGLFFAEKTKTKFERFEVPKDIQHTRTPLFLATNMTKEANDFWIGSFLSTIFKLDNSNSTPLLEKVTFKDVPGRISFDVKLINKNSLLIGATDGLFKFSLDTKKLEALTTPKEFSQVTHVNYLNNQYWFLSNQKVYILNEGADAPYQLSLDDLPFSSSSYAVQGIYSDFESNVWISMQGNGLLQYSPFLNRFQKARNFLRNKRNINLLDTLESGDIVYSQDKKTTIESQKILHDVISHSILDYKDSLFFGGEGKVTQFINDKKIEIKLPGTEAPVISLYIDTLQRLWVVDDIKGLYLYDLKAQSFIDTKSIETKGSNQVQTLGKSLDGKLLLLSRQTVTLVDTSEENKQLSSSNVLTYESEVLNHWWNDGFVVSEHQNQQVSILDSRSLEINYLNLSKVRRIGCAYYSEDFGLWIAEKNGAVLNFDRNGKLMRRYSTSDGLPSGGVDGLHCLRKDELMYFTSHQGVFQISPKEVKLNERPPATNLLKLSDKLSNLNFTEEENQYKLNSENLPLTIQFYSESAVSPKENRVRYKLNSVSNDWQEHPIGSNELVFDHLEEQRHEILIQTSNNDATWGETLRIPLEVHPPVWLTWWAKSVYFALIVFVFFFALRFRTRYLTQKAEKLEAQVKERTSQLEAVLDKKNEEFANVSHEFRTPLTLVIGPTQRLISEEESEGKKTTLSMVKRNSYRLLRMVDQLLHLEKFRVQEIVEKTEISVKPIAKLIGESFKELAKEQEIDLTIKNLDEAWIYFTPDALEKILLNLLSNAIKYSNAGDSIELSVGNKGTGKLEIIVKDTGIGIPEDKLDEVFGRFSRVLDNHSEQITGAGIGLSLVKELVDNHGGTIKLESKLGEGSCFTVTLPTCNAPAENTQVNLLKTNTEILDMEIESLVEQRSEPSKIETDNGSSLADNRPTILIVEDNQDMRSYITSTLSDRFNVITAINGQEGLAIAREQIPDLIVSDVMMPLMDGFTLCHSLKSDELTSHIPLILLTARSDRDSRLRGWKEQADEYLTKPFDAEELVIRVNNLLGIRELLKQRFYTAVQSGPELKDSVQIAEAVDKADDENKQWEAHQRIFFDKFTTQLESSFANSELKVSHLARELAMTERQLYRKLKGVINQTPAEYLKNYRLEKALELIKKGEPVGNISFDVGFSSHSYFSKCFKAKFGKAPSEYVS